MALWGNNDNVSVQANGTVALNYGTRVVTGTGTTFGTSGYAQPGQVIRFGNSDLPGISTYYGDAVIVSVASTISLTIGSTAGLSGVAIAGTSFQISELPKNTTINPQWEEQNEPTGADVYVYGVGEWGVDQAAGTAYETSAGWVGVTTYMGVEGELRVKKEVLVAMSGITTGNTPLYDSAPNA
jgi:hypothetical protein